MSRLRAIFFGSPAFAVPCLEAACEVADVVRVVTQPDRPAGRGLETRPPAVKQRALERGLQVMQPTQVRDASFADELSGLEADVGIVVAYGRILPAAVLTAPRAGCVNVHASLLPRWRGAAPVQHAIVHGDRATGVCLMKMDEGMDTGPVIACEKTAVDPDETAEHLSRRLSDLGGELLRRELPGYVSGKRAPMPQDESAATYASLLRKDDGRIDWQRSAREVHDHVRGMTPWPGAFTVVGDRRLKVHRTRVAQEEGELGIPGTIVRAEGDVLEVACGKGTVALEALQLEGKRKMGPRELLAGSRWEPGTRLGEVSETVEGGR